MRSIYLVPLCLLIACGDNKENEGRPDARPRPDAFVPQDAPAVIPCAYTEMSDATNDDLFGTGDAETTGIAFASPGTAICGKFNMGHFSSMNVDVDSYSFTVAAGSMGTLYLTAPGAENLDTVLIEIYHEVDNIDETGEFVGTFAAAPIELVPGKYFITVSAYDAADTTSAIDYKLLLAVDSPARCPKATAAAVFTEAGETVVGGGNDVYQVQYGQNSTRTLTANVLDNPEATGLTVEPDMSYRVSGASSTFTVTPASWSDSFQDRDTYAVTMGATTNLMSIRLNWPGTTADFDMMVFPMGGTTEQADGYYGANMEDEFVTLAVTPGATYWVFVGMDDASTGQPVSYDLTFCGDTFTP